MPASTKISVSLTEDDIAILDAYARLAKLPSRSAAIQQAIQLLNQLELETDYRMAWAEWNASDESAAWDSVVGDGLTDAAR